MKCNEQGVVNKVDFIKAAIHDSRVFESLLGKERETYADSVYRSKKHENILKRRGIESEIQKRNYRHKKLSEQEIKENKVNARTRVIVARVFGIWKLHYGARKCRYVGLARNRIKFFLLVISYNLKVSCRLMR